MGFFNTDSIVKELIIYFIRRVRRDSLGLEAASLAFTSVLALIPVLSVVMSIFAVVPSFSQARDALKNFAAANFMPVFYDAINSYVSSLVEHAASLTLTSTRLLFVIAFMLVRSIDNALNRIWRGGKRRLGSKMAIYWTLLTLGPMALGMIIWIFTKVLSYAFSSGTGIEIPVLIAYFIFPIIIEVVVITALFTIVPAVSVKLQDAFLGAVLVTVSFEISKKLFSTFVLNFSNYEALYGALAALPVLMIWIYINWWLVLLGAEFTATLGIIRSGMSEKVPSFMLMLANMTGSTLGSDSLNESRKKRSHIKIKVSARR